MEVTLTDNTYGCVNFQISKWMMWISEGFTPPFNIYRKIDIMESLPDSEKEEVDKKQTEKGRNVRKKKNEL